MAECGPDVMEETMVRASLTGLLFAIAFTPASTAQCDLGVLLAADEGAGDRFGVSIATTEDFVVVGSPRDDDMAVDSGAAYVFSGFGALPIELDRFLAVRAPNGNAYLAWLTLAELDTAGFNLYRAPWVPSAGGQEFTADAVRINSSLIPSEGSAFQGELYRFIDSGTVYAERQVYWLEDIDISGQSTLHGPFPVR